MDDQQIISSLKRREEAGLRELMRRYGPLLRYVVSPILPDPREAEECLSDIYMKLWGKMDSFDRSKGSLNAWLTAVARNAALNRARRLCPEEPLEDAAHPSQESAEETVLRRERQAILLAVVNELSEKERALFYRKYYYCQSTAQMAAELGLSVRAVEGRLYRLREKLRKRLGGEDWDG